LPPRLSDRFTNLPFIDTATLKDKLNMYFDDECKTCDREFGSQQAAIQHMDALNHWGPRYECDTCDREFFTQRSADQHMDDKGHWEPSSSARAVTRSSIPNCPLINIWTLEITTSDTTVMIVVNHSRMKMP
jgi:hypothetical protein